MTWVACVLYENKRNEAGKGYPLHQLVCAMVDDRLGQTGQWRAHALVEGRPRGGKDKVLAECRGERLAKTFAGLGPGRRFALIDGDRLDRNLDLPGDALLDEVRHELARRYPDVSWCLPDAARRLASNTEAILEVVVGCLPLARDDRTAVEAIDEKDRVARDRLFARAARDPRHVRECIRQGQPSLAAMVDQLAALVDAAGR